MKALLSILFAATAIFAATAARADDAPRPPVRVGASHRVDVIAPGERVETVIDRMRRANPAAAAPDARTSDRTGPRGPDSLRGADRGPAPDGPRPAAGAAPNQPPNPGPTPPHR